MIEVILRSRFKVAMQEVDHPSYDSHASVDAQTLQECRPNDVTFDIGGGWEAGVTWRDGELVGGSAARRVGRKRRRAELAQTAEALCRRSGVATRRSRAACFRHSTLQLSRRCTRCTPAPRTSAAMAYRNDDGGDDVTALDSSTQRTNEQTNKQTTERININGRVNYSSSSFVSSNIHAIRKWKLMCTGRRITCRE